MKAFVFGLGDTSYSQYNVVSRRLAARLQQLGAEVMLGLGDYQDRNGHYQELIPFLESLWLKLSVSSPLPVSLDSCSPIKKSFDTTNIYFPEIAVYSNTSYILEPSPIICNERITSATHFQDIRRVVFRVSERLVNQLLPGAVILLQPKNPNEIVNSLLEYYSMNSQTVVNFFKNDMEYNITVETLFTSFLAICDTPNRYFLEQLSFFATSVLLSLFLENI